VAVAPWYYFVMLVPFLAGFIYIPSAIGAMLCLAVVHGLPSRRRLVLGLSGALALGGAAWIAWSMISAPEGNMLTLMWFHQLLGRLRFTEHPLLPSWWLSSGLLEAARGQWRESCLFLALLVANGLFFRELAIRAAGAWYRPAFSALQGSQGSRKRTHLAWLDRCLLRLTVFLPLQMRLLVIKDLRVFRRDPVQWSQLAILFGLLGLYFLNIRRFTYDVYYAGSVHMVSFLNLSVVGLLLAIFNTRFIFPMVSVEGRRFWILGLLPLRRETILWSKFCFAAFGFMVPSALLILLSDAMLRVSGTVMASHQLTCVLLSVGLSGIAVGLGAKLPSVREPSPSRIAAGFGGTLNLVVSALYIVLVVASTALPCHFALALPSQGVTHLNSWPIQQYASIWLLAGTSISVLLTIVATVVPLRIGFRAFREMEF